MTRFFLIAIVITFAINFTQAAPLSEEGEKPLINPYKDVVCERLNDLFTKAPVINKYVAEIFEKGIRELEKVDNITLRLRSLNEIYHETCDQLLFESNELRKIIKNKNATFSQEAMKSQQDLQNAMEIFKSKTKKLEFVDADLTLAEIFIVRMYSLDDCQEVQLFIPVVDNIYAAYRHIDLDTFMKDLKKFASRTKEITAEGLKLPQTIIDDE